MKSFSYRAASIEATISEGRIDAEDRARASALLTKRGLYPIALTEVAPSKRRKASRRELAIVFRGIAALVSAGVPLERAIAATEGLASEALCEVLSHARAQLREGSSLASALFATGGVIPTLVVGMVRAGEQGSQLGVALDEVAAHLEHEAELISRVRQALTYPLLLAFTGTISLVIIALVVVPRFAPIFQDLGTELPFATRVLLGSSQFFSHFWPLVLLSVSVGAAITVDRLRRPSGRRRAESVVYRLPYVGRVRQALVDARVLRALGGMLRSGMPLIRALDASREAAGDLIVSDRLKRSTDAVLRGVALTSALETEGALTPNSLQLLRVGETSGRVAEMALGAANLAAQEADRGLRVLVTMLEPALIIAFGGLVAFSAAALLQAVYSLRPGGP